MCVTLLKFEMIYANSIQVAFTFIRDKLYVMHENLVLFCTLYFKFKFEI